MRIDYEKRIRIDSRLFENGTERPFGHIAGMIWNRCVPVCRWVEPDFMTARGLTIKLESESLQLPRDFAVTKA